MPTPERSGGRAAAAPLLCPSASADAQGAVVIGVVQGGAGPPRVAYLETPFPVTPELLERAAPVPPNQVLRTAAACVECACSHFDGAACTLASRIVAMVPPAVDRPPPCSIRPRCRWWKQEGRAACARCPEVVTETAAASDSFRRAAQPPAA